MRYKKFVLSVKPKEIRKAGFLSKADHFTGCMKCDEYAIYANLLTLSSLQQQKKMKLEQHKDLVKHQREEFKRMKTTLISGKIIMQSHVDRIDDK